MNYILIIIMIISSGTAIGWMIPGSATIQFAVSMLGIGYYLLRKRSGSVRKQNMWILVTSIAVFAMNVLVTSGVQTVILYYNMFFSLISVYVITEMMSFQEYSEKYVNVMVFLSITSIFFWLLAQFGQTIGDFSVLATNGKYYRLNLFYVYRNGDIFSTLIYNSPRNSGIFWEPGAFQGYLNLALMFLLFSKKKIDTKKDKREFYIKIFVLIGAVLSTQSTTGYMILVLVFMMYYFQYVRRNKITVKAIIGVLIMMAVVAVVLNSNVVQMKFNSDSSSYVSTAIRMNDNINGIKAVFISPFVGLGFNSPQYSDVMKSLSIEANSSGLLLTLQQFGIIIGGLILARIFFNLHKLLGLKGFSVSVFIILMLCMMSTEAFVTKEIFTIFLFNFNKINSKEKKSPYVNGFKEYNMQI